MNASLSPSQEVVHALYRDLGLIITRSVARRHDSPHRALHGLVGHNDPEQALDHHAQDA